MYPCYSESWPQWVELEWDHFISSQHICRKRQILQNIKIAGCKVTSGYLLLLEQGKQEKYKNIQSELISVCYPNIFLFPKTKMFHEWFQHQAAGSAHHLMKNVNIFCSHLPQIMVPSYKLTGIHYFTILLYLPSWVGNE